MVGNCANQRRAVNCTYVACRGHQRQRGAALAEVRSSTESERNQHCGSHTGEGETNQRAGESWKGHGERDAACGHQPTKPCDRSGARIRGEEVRPKSSQCGSRPKTCEACRRDRLACPTELAEVKRAPVRS